MGCFEYKRPLCRALFKTPVLYERKGEIARLQPSADFPTIAFTVIFQPKQAAVFKYKTIIGGAPVKERKSKFLKIFEKELPNTHCRRFRYRYTWRRAWRIEQVHILKFSAFWPPFALNWSPCAEKRKIISPGTRFLLHLRLIFREKTVSGIKLTFFIKNLR